MKRSRHPKRRRLRIRLLLRHAVLVLVLLGAGAVMFIAMGMAPIAADAGHWAATRVLLHSAMSRAVEVRAMKLSAPALDDPARRAGMQCGRCCRLRRSCRKNWGG